MELQGKTYHDFSFIFHVYPYRSDEGLSYTIHNTRYTLPSSNIIRVNYILFYSYILFIYHRVDLLNKVLKSIHGQQMLAAVVVVLLKA